MSDKHILITRYPNRRLYNTKSSEYINLSDVSSLVKKGNSIKIEDKETGEDLTKQYLLQIISNIENKDGDVLSENILVEIIKNYNENSQKLMPDMLEKTFEFYQQQQNEFLKKFSNNSNSFFNDTESETFKDWQTIQMQFMNNLFNTWDLNKKNNHTKNQKQNLSTKEEIDILKQQMSELKKQLNKNI